MSRRFKPARQQRTDDRRPVIDRLAALVAERGEERSRRILWRIRRDLDDAPDPGPWIAAARTLRDRGLIDDDTVIYFGELFTECVIAHASQTDRELVRIRAAMDHIEIAHGLSEDESWYVNEAPLEWQALNAEWDRRADAIVTAKLYELGCDDLAALREHGMDDWEERANRGHANLWSWRDD